MEALASNANNTKHRHVMHANAAQCKRLDHHPLCSKLLQCSKLPHSKTLHSKLLQGRRKFPVGGDGDASVQHLAATRWRTFGSNKVAHIWQQQGGA
jgi:hypothetical protein